MDKKVFYLGYYDIPEYAAEKRNAPPAAVTKINYVISVLNRLGCSVMVFSPAATTDKSSARPRTVPLQDKNQLRVFRCIGGRNKLASLLRFAWLKLSLIISFLTQVRSGDFVFVYHSPEYMRTLLLLKRLVRFRLILEVEEIYADVTGVDKIREKEFRVFRRADAFILSTELLEERINTRKVPSCVSYGTYMIPETQEKTPFEDGKIHCVYAGTFDHHKGGAQLAVKTAQYLSKEYHLHILGFGTEDDTRALKEEIARISSLTQATITFEGMLTGSDYLGFISRCDIGLSTQLADGSFNETSFPSKILSYFTNGLQVVSVPLRVLKCSALDPYIEYFNEYSPQAAAEAVRRIRRSDPQSVIRVIQTLDASFSENVRRLLSGS